MIEKDIIDEIIFRTDNPRNRLMLELMARGGLRIGEVLNLRPKNCQGCKLILSDTKGGREIEVAFIPQKISDRFKDHIQNIPDKLHSGLVNCGQGWQSCWDSSKTS